MYQLGTDQSQLSTSLYHLNSEDGTPLLHREYYANMRRPKITRVKGFNKRQRLQIDKSNHHLPARDLFNIRGPIPISKTLDEAIRFTDDPKVNIFGTSTAINVHGDSINLKERATAICELPFYHKSWRTLAGTPWRPPGTGQASSRLRHIGDAIARMYAWDPDGNSFLKKFSYGNSDSYIAALLISTENLPESVKLSAKLINDTAHGIPSEFIPNIKVIVDRANPYKKFAKSSVILASIAAPFIAGYFMFPVGAGVVLNMAAGIDTMTRMPTATIGGAGVAVASASRMAKGAIKGAMPLSGGMSSAAMDVGEDIVTYAKRTEKLQDAEALKRVKKVGGFTKVLQKGWGTAAFLTSVMLHHTGESLSAVEKAALTGDGQLGLLAWAAKTMIQTPLLFLGGKIDTLIGGPLRWLAGDWISPASSLGKWLNYFKVETTVAQYASNNPGMSQIVATAGAAVVASALTYQVGNALADWVFSDTVPTQIALGKVDISPYLICIAPFEKLLLSSYSQERNKGVNLALASVHYYTNIVNIELHRPDHLMALFAALPQPSVGHAADTAKYRYLRDLICRYIRKSRDSPQLMLNVDHSKIVELMVAEAKKLMPNESDEKIQEAAAFNISNMFPEYSKTLLKHLKSKGASGGGDGGDGGEEEKAVRKPGYDPSVDGSAKGLRLPFPTIM